MKNDKNFKLKQINTGYDIVEIKNDIILNSKDKLLDLISKLILEKFLTEEEIKSKLIEIKNAKNNECILSLKIKKIGRNVGKDKDIFDLAVSILPDLFSSALKYFLNIFKQKQDIISTMKISSNNNKKSLTLKDKNNNIVFSNQHNLDLKTLKKIDFYEKIKNEILNFVKPFLNVKIIEEVINDTYQSNYDREENPLIYIDGFEFEKIFNQTKMDINIIVDDGIKQFGIKKFIDKINKVLLSIKDKNKINSISLFVDSNNNLNAIMKNINNIQSNIILELYGRNSENFKIYKNNLFIPFYHRESFLYFLKYYNLIKKQSSVFSNIILTTNLHMFNNQLIYSYKSNRIKNLEKIGIKYSFNFLGGNCLVNPEGSYVNFLNLQEINLYLSSLDVKNEYMFKRFIEIFNYSRKNKLKINLLFEIC